MHSSRKRTSNSLIKQVSLVGTLRSKVFFLYFVRGLARRFKGMKDILLYDKSNKSRIFISSSFRVSAQ